MCVLKAVNLEFRYKQNLVFKNINLNIEEGKFVSIIGPNGSGKSTLLKILNNIHKANKGEVFIYDKNINSYKSKDLARKVSLVPQDTNINYDFLVEDIVMMGRYPYKKRFEKEDTSDYEIIENALEMTNTRDLRKRLITEISGGERQRVIIARALAQNSSIVLLDEPTSNLDINYEIEILNLLGKLNKDNNTTIVVAMHNINLAARYSDKIILLNNGKILGEGVPEEVITVENIKKAYNLEVAIDKNKYTNTIYLTPLEVKK